MTRLQANESGRVVYSLAEEVNGLRRARTRLEFGSFPADLFILAKPHSPDSPDLHVHLDEQVVGVLKASNEQYLRWYRVTISEAPSSFEGYVTLASSGGAMTGWSVAVDYSTGGGDWLSTDAGRTWQSERIGSLHVAPGRYVVRARIPRGNDPTPPGHAWEKPDAASLDELKLSLPIKAVTGDGSWSAIRELSTWVCRSLDYRNTSDGFEYAPWDPLTILAWGPAGRGTSGKPVITMCVHYSVVLVAACQALGIPARCAALTGSINGSDGHFVVEVWVKELNRWAMVDPTYDVVVVNSDGPLGIREIRQLGNRLRDCVHVGPGTERRLAREGAELFFNENLLQGMFLRNRSVWPRSDFLSRPELSPPGHGTSSYCELDLVWEEDARDRGFDMFRYFATDDWFDAPPIPTGGASAR